MTGPVIPCFRYVDAPAAIGFLCDAFGFERHAVHADAADPSIVLHAQLVFGGGMVMLGSARAEPTQARFGWRTPEEAGGCTMSIYLVVEDPDAHCARARAHGAQIIDAPRDNEGYPGRGYSARDPEGHVWSFGSYDPWAK